jgi:predicted ester cyclase
VQGADEIVRAVEPWLRAFPDLQARIRDTVASSDALVVELEWTGTHKGPLAGPSGPIPPTGKAGKLTAVQVVRFDGDRIREIRHYFDLLSLLRQLDYAPQLGATAADAR